MRKYQRPVSLLLYSLLQAARRSKGIYVPTSPLWVAGAKHSSSDNNSLLADRKYCQKVDPGQKLLQFAFRDNFLGCRGC
jgi:hypothetical protein